MPGGAVGEFPDGYSKCVFKRVIKDKREVFGFSEGRMGDSGCFTHASNTVKIACPVRPSLSC